MSRPKGLNRRLIGKPGSGQDPLTGEVSRDCLTGRYEVPPGRTRRHTSQWIWPRPATPAETRMRRAQAQTTWLNASG